MSNLETKAALSLFEQLQQVRDPFNHRKIWPSIDIFSKNRHLAPWLPISEFRHGARFWYCGQEESRRFHSSGTTSQSRSLSLFSNDGLELYRSSSAALFRYVIEAVSGKNFDNFAGVSLIPQTSEWPDSSLAQMLGWIEDGSTPKIQFATNQTFKEFCQSQEKPLWVFGTAFHFINAIDEGFASQLPKGSIIVETGGTKGRSRKMERGEFYHLLSKEFSVPTHKIVSEYGMCELASQAYDFLPADQLDFDRKFRFPSWVKLNVAKNKTEMDDLGEGALIVHDSLRVDYPYPLRTDDIVNLDAGMFSLLGRANLAPLKGCSLKAETTAAPQKTLQQQFQNKPAKDSRPNPQKIKSSLLKFCRSETASRALGDDIGSHKNAKELLLGLCRCIEESDFQKASIASVGKSRLGRWIIILPESHPLVGIYPIAMGLAAGLSLDVRVPKQLENGFIPSLIKMFAAVSEASITECSSSLRVTRQTQGYQGILVYGDDETIRLIKDTTSIPVSGFGNKLAVADLTELTLENATLNQVAIDAFSLGQQGCMSTRLAIASPDFNKRDANVIAAYGQYLWSAGIPIDNLLAIDSQQAHFSRLGFTTSDSSLSPLVCFTSEHSALKLHNLVARHPFVLPILLTNERENTLERIQSELPELGLITTNGPKLKAHPIPQRKLGKAQYHTWDGYHELRPIFVPDPLKNQPN